MDIVHPILQWHKDIRQEPRQLHLIVLFPLMPHESIVEPMDHIFKKILFRQMKQIQIYFSTRFKHEIPSCPPTAKRQPSSTATPTLVRHELVGAISLLH
jgi:hypothetical protein